MGWCPLCSGSPHKVGVMVTLLPLYKGLHEQNKAHPCLAGCPEGGGSSHSDHCLGPCVVPQAERLAPRSGLRRGGGLLMEPQGRDAVVASEDGEVWRAWLSLAPSLTALFSAWLRGAGAWWRHFSKVI